ncbi:MAG: GNAT family N-acetyltransferase [Verrucomicrobiota bacterium]|nr:GNAT family N-acetyltransferase [Blastocatellia bacterium]MDQ3545795.1 GNAT family N-acetyltransferase [Verrucomicrobiota bacterium]
MSKAAPCPEVIVRHTRLEDFNQIIEMTREVYHDSPSWKVEQLSSHLEVFPEGQFVAAEKETGRVVGMAASLIVSWDDYDMRASWRDFTDHGTFQNHNPGTGRTLYGAEVMVRPSEQGRGIGRKIYAARRELVRRMGLLRIRAGARLCGYHLHADRLSPEKYVTEVLAGRLSDPTLNFQLKQGFIPLAVAPDYLHHDPESLGFAAVIEWLNPEIARPEHYAARHSSLPES